MSIPADEGPDPFEVHIRWLDQLRTEVLDPKRFRTRPNSELAKDDAVVGGALFSEVVQLQIHSAVDHLLSALHLFVDNTTFFPVPTLARAALESAGTAAWLLGPESQAERIARLVHFKLQDSRDEFTFARIANQAEHTEQRLRLLKLGESVGQPRSRFKDSRRSYSMTRVIRDLEEVLGGPLVSSWALLSGLAHGRRWALRVSATQEELFTTEEGRQVFKLELPPSLLAGAQLEAGRVLDQSVRHWNARSGNDARRSLATCELP